MVNPVNRTWLKSETNMRMSSRINLASFRLKGLRSMLSLTVNCFPCFLMAIQLFCRRLLFIYNQLTVQKKGFRLNYDPLSFLVRSKLLAGSIFSGLLLALLMSMRAGYGITRRNSSRQEFMAAKAPTHTKAAVIGDSR